MNYLENFQVVIGIVSFPNRTALPNVYLHSAINLLLNQSAKSKIKSNIKTTIIIEMQNHTRPRSQEHKKNQEHHQLTLCSFTTSEEPFPKHEWNNNNSPKTDSRTPTHRVTCFLYVFSATRHLVMVIPVIQSYLLNSPVTNWATILRASHRLLQIHTEVVASYLYQMRRSVSSTTQASIHNTESFACRWTPNYYLGDCATRRTDRSSNFLVVLQGV